MDYSQITQADVDGFRANLNMTPQVMESVYLPHVNADYAYSAEGKLFNADEIGTSDPKDIDTVVPDSPEGLVDMTRRVGSFKGFHDGKFIESVQKVHQLQDPTDSVMKAMRAGKMRKHDALVRNSFFAPVRIGEEGENSLDFPTSRIIGVADRKFLHQEEVPGLPASGALPLTTGKLARAWNLISKSYILKLFPNARPKIAVRSDDISQLLSTIPVTSGDYNAVKRLENGEITTFKKFEFVIDEDVNLKAGSTDTYLLPCWLDQAIQVKIREIHMATITLRADKSMRPYAYYESQHGALRAFDGGVVGIEVKDL
ncbi:MAG: phage capsid protein [Brevundimonas sp.]